LIDIGYTPQSYNVLRPSSDKPIAVCQRLGTKQGFSHVFLVIYLLL
jgi:hypothetical protein